MIGLADLHIIEEWTIDPGGGVRSLSVLLVFVIFFSILSYIVQLHSAYLGYSELTLKLDIFDGYDGDVAPVNIPFECIAKG